MRMSLQIQELGQCHVYFLGYSHAEKLNGKMGRKPGEDQPGVSENSTSPAAQPRQGVKANHPQIRI